MDAENWATHFPPGYRERIAPQVLGAIYSSGKTAKLWAKEWIKERGLGECDEARSLIPLAAGIDAVILVDQVEGSINQVGMEKMARKAMGIQAAFKEVHKEEHWKPKAKGAKSKVDREMWRRYDPEMADSDEHLFINRNAENEVRTEMDRDAALLKAKAKLNNRGS